MIAKIRIRVDAEYLRAIRKTDERKNPQIKRIKRKVKERLR